MKSPKSLTVMLAMFVVVALLSLSVANPVCGATTGDTGLDRWVNLEVSEDPGVDADSNYTTTVNITVGETIAENHTFSGSISHTYYVNKTYTNNWVNITIANATWTNTFTSGAMARSGNGSTSFEIDSNVPTNRWYNASVSFENNRSQSDSQSDLDLNTTSNSAYSVMMTVGIINSLIPIIIVVAVMLPIIFKVIGSVDEEMD